MAEIKMLKYIVMLLMVAQVSMAEDAIEQSGYLAKAKQVGEHVWIGPQPTKQDFDELAADEIGAVINNRTEAETKQLDFNETEQASKYNMTYDLLQIGEGHAYSPAKLTEFNALMTANAGKNVLLHCRSGNRSTQLYTAWLIKYQGKSEAEALEAVGSEETELNDSVNTLLGRPILK
jgi:sulfide:quinone oxidoreductase